jgi:hypothetical protein
MVKPGNAISITADNRPLKMGSPCYLETAGANLPVTRRGIPEERRPQKTSLVCRIPLTNNIGGIDEYNDDDCKDTYEYIHKFVIYLYMYL